MSFIPYREKRFGKLSLIIFALIVLVVAGGCVFGGVCAVLFMHHWSKFIILGVACVLGLAFLVFAILLLIITASMTGKTKSVRDGNVGKGIEDVRLCDKCGRVISKSATFCEHCGNKQLTGHGMKTCPECKTKNSATAKFCENCRHEFED